MRLRGYNCTDPTFRRLNRMRKALIAFMALALVAAVPATAAAHSGNHGKGHDVKNAARYCRSLRAQMGADVFHQTYATFGKCVSQRVAELRAARRSARNACQTEKGKAFGQCVRTKFRAVTSDDDNAVLNAAKECENEQQADEPGFEDKYGTNHNKRNAFGKCVSSKADVENENDNEADDQSGDDNGDNGADHQEPGDVPGHQQS
jgi:hypothetical protein